MNKSNITDLSGNEKVIIANNIENWGTYSKFSVTKLINPDGVDKAVLTQSLLRLASSTNNVNVISPRDSSNFSSSMHQEQHISNKDSSFYYNQSNKSKGCSESNLQQIQSAKQPSVVYAQPLSNCYPATETISTTTTTTKTQTMSSQHTTTTSSSGAYDSGSTVVHVTRQF